MSPVRWNVRRVRFTVVLFFLLIFVVFFCWIQYNDLTWTGSLKDINDVQDDFKHRTHGKAENRRKIRPVHMLNSTNVKTNLNKVVLENGKTHLTAQGNRDAIVPVVKGFDKQKVIDKDEEKFDIKLLRASQPKKFPIFHKDFEKPKFVEGRNLNAHWTPPWVPTEAYVFDTTSFPKNTRLSPSIGNGHVATVIHSDSIFMNGLYNGAGSDSHRARIPSVSAINITSISPPVTHKRTYSLDVVQAVYSERIVSKDYEIIQRVYAHRIIPQLLVTEIEMARSDPNVDMKIFLSQNSGKVSKDINFTEVNSNRQKVVHKVGRVKVSETSSTPLYFVHLYYDEIPKFLPVPKGLSRCQWFFVASIGNDAQETEQAYKIAIDQIRTNKLLSSHVEAWASLWKTGRIDVAGSLWISKALYGSLYYILSSLPLQDEANGLISFIGLSPTGLASGNTEQDYQGHVFWDQETWMFPSVLMMHAELSKTILKSRIRTRSAALENAKMNHLKGSQFPWESGLSGYEVTESKNCAKYEIHVNGDIALALQKYIYMTNNTQFFANEEGKYLALDIAKFWASRVTKNSLKNMYEVLGVMGPDEYHPKVNNSAYTNAICRISLELAQHICKLLKIPPDPEWSKISQNMYIPYNKKEQYHPEFDGYDYKSKPSSSKIKQADVVLLGYPLQQQMSLEARRHDLRIYAKATDLSGPSMTWSMYSIGWLELKDSDTAADMFDRNMAYITSPFQVWTEVGDGSGAVNFLTGMGGFLQNVLFGYGGFRAHKDRLELDPVLPPNTNTFNVTGLDYLGAVFDFITVSESFTVVLRYKPHGNFRFVVEIASTKWRENLVINRPTSLHRGKAYIIPVKS